MRIFVWFKMSSCAECMRAVREAGSRRTRGWSMLTVTLTTKCMTRFVMIYMNECMYVCIYVSMYLCMYVWCMYACMYVCMYVCMTVCMTACMTVCMYVCMHVCVYVCSLDAWRKSSVILMRHWRTTCLRFVGGLKVLYYLSKTCLPVYNIWLCYLWCKRLNFNHLLHLD